MTEHDEQQPIIEGDVTNPTPTPGEAPASVEAASTSEPAAQADQEPTESPENADASVAETPAETEPATEAAAPDDSAVPDEAATADEATDGAEQASAASAEAAPAEAKAPEQSAPAAPAPTPRPTPARIPSPAAIAKAAPRPPAAATPAAPAPVPAHVDPSESMKHGRVAEDGTVFVITPDGEREVGSYPGASNEEALGYFARKYDELFAHAQLLRTRADMADVPAKDVADAMRTLREQVAEAKVVGDLAALEALLTETEQVVEAKREQERLARAEAKQQARTEREDIVARAEAVAGQPTEQIQWKDSAARMRDLLEEWKAHQRKGPRLDKDDETALWQRFSAARNGFDRARKAWFAQLDATHAEAKKAKEALVAEAELLQKSTDWNATAGAFKRLMDQWRRAGRAGRKDDDALWARFKAAQDAFFAAKDEVVAAEEESYKGNLAVKEELLVEAEKLVPVKDLEQTKAALRRIQDKWDAAGKVPRADIERVESRLRKVEQAVRDAEDRKWGAKNPEAAARASSFVTQLETAVASLESDIAAAQTKGDDRKVKKLTSELEAKQAWLKQAQAGLAEFG